MSSHTTSKRFTAGAKLYVDWTISSTNANISTGGNVSTSTDGEPLATSMGKIAKWYTDFTPLVFSKKKVDGVTFDQDIIHYATCSTAASTTSKTVDCTGFNLVTGAWIAVRFTVTNTGAVANLTLNVNNTGAKSIKYRNANLSSAGVLAANRTYMFVYDGTYYQIIGDLDTNSNNYDRIQLQERLYAGGVGVFPYCLCAMNNNQRIEAFTTTGGTGTSKVWNTSAKFLYPPNILYHYANSTIANGNVIANATLYESRISELQYSSNLTTTNNGFSRYKAIYLEISFDSDGLWSPTTTGITQTLTSGKYYIFLGGPYNTSIYQLCLNTNNPVYYYDGTNLIDANLIRGVKSVTVSGTGNAVTTASLSNGNLTLEKGTTFLHAGNTSYTPSVTSGTKLGTITIDGTSTDVYSTGKLDSPVNIELGTGVLSTATAFDGSQNITIPVTAIREAYLEWGGKDFSASYSPLDAALNPRLGANRMEMTKAAGITIERSTDSGSTWTTVDVSDINKQTLMSSIGYSIAVSGTSTANLGTNAAKNIMRVTIDTVAGSIYTYLNKFIIYLTINGCTGCYVKIRIRTQTNFLAGNDTWKTWDCVNKSWSSSVTESNSRCPVDGWSGFNVINFGGLGFTTYGNQSWHQRNIQFIFGCETNTSTYAGMSIISIQGYGGVGWTTPSTMAKTGHLYSYDGMGAATFPSTISATSFNGKLNGFTVNGTSNATYNLNNFLTEHQTYTAVTGKPTANQTPSFGETFTIQQISQSTTGQITATDRTVKIPAITASDLPTHTHDYLPLSGGTLTGPLVIKGSAASKPLITRGIYGYDGWSAVGDLYIQFTESGSIGKTYFGGSTYYISADGSTYNGSAAKVNGHTVEKDVPSDAVFTDAKVIQTNTTGAAAYRVLLSGNANDTTETTTARKSTNLQFNPSTGVLTQSGTTFGGIIVTRSGNTSGASIAFKNTNGILGYIGFTGNADTSLQRWLGSDTDTRYTVHDTGNTSYTATVTSSTSGHYTIGTLKLGGSNVTIYGKDTVYTHPSGFTAKTTAGFYKYTVDTNGHVSAGAALTKSDITSLGIASSDHTHNYIPLSGSDNISGRLAFNDTDIGVWGLDKQSHLAPLIIHNSANLWIGQFNTNNENTAHYGATFISTGIDITDASNPVPYSTINIVLPNGDNQGSYKTYHALHSGNTSISRSLTSGTKIATITIDGNATDLYCQTNSNTTYTLSGAYGSNNNTWVTTLTPSSGNSTTSTVPMATTAAYGITKLSSATNSTSTDLAATPYAVKAAYDLASSKSTVLFSNYISSNGSNAYKIATITIDGNATDIYGEHYISGYNWDGNGNVITSVILANGKWTFYKNLYCLKAEDVIQGTGISITTTGSTSSDAPQAVTINHSNSVTAVTTAGMLKVKYDAQGHITGSSSITKSDITGLGISASDHTHSNYLGATIVSGNVYYGMADPDGTDTNWIRTTSKGIIPYQSGSRGDGHSQLGTSTYYFSTSYIDNMYSGFINIAGDLPQLKFQQTTSESEYNSTNAGIKCYPGDTSGMTMTIQSGGNMIIGSGEFPTNFYNATKFAAESYNDTTGEKTYIGSDGNVYVITNGNTIEDRNVFIFGTNFVLSTGGNVVFRHGTYDSYTSSALTSAATTTARTWTLPDKTGTIALTSDLVDTKVTQSAATGNNYRPLIMGNKYSTTAGDSALQDTVTAQVYTNASIYANPNTGTICANRFKGPSDYIRHCYAKNETALTNKWIKIATCTSTSANDDRMLVLLVSNGYASAYQGHGILRCRFRTGSTNGTLHTASLSWDYITNGLQTPVSTSAPDKAWATTHDINPSNFVATYTATSGTSLVYDLWVKVAANYQSWTFTALNDASRAGNVWSPFWTLSDYANTGGQDALPSSTGQVVSKVATLYGINDNPNWVTLTNGSQLNSASVLKCKKQGNIVYIKGMFGVASTTGTITPMAVLPDGYYATDELRHISYSPLIIGGSPAAGTGDLQINTTGTMNLYTNNSSTFTGSGTNSAVYIMDVSFMI